MIKTEIWEVDLRSRKTGDTIETIYSGNHDEAFRVMTEWYDNHLEFWEIIPREEIGTSTVEKFIDGSDGVFADCYAVDEPHGIGKWE